MIERLVSELRKQGVRIRSDGDRVVCDAPPHIITPELREQLREHKDQIIEFLNNEVVAAKGDDELAIPTIPRTTEIPLSFAQESLWFLAQLKSASASYNIPIKLRLLGEVDGDILRRSLTEIVRRHEILRTCYRTVAGRPIQVIAAPEPFSLPIVDLLAIPEEAREAEVARLCGEEAQRPFALDHDLMLRAVLYRFEKTKHILFLNIHHIASDAWSLEIFLREFGTLYEAFSQGRSSPLGELPVQYADFAAWQRKRLTDDIYARQLEYWRRQLEGAVPLLDLPTERPRPPVQTFRGSVETSSLPASLSDSLNILSRREGVSLFMTLLAAFQVLLYRYSGQQDISVGSPIANRGRTGLERLIGLFVNTLPLRVDLSGNPTFRQLLVRAREVVLGAYENQDIPFEALVKDLHPERNLSYSPLFQVLFAVQNAAPGIVDLKVQSEFVSSATSKFDLSLYMREHSGGMDAEIEYCTDLFGKEMVRQMLDHFTILLRSIIENPDEHINTLPLLTNRDQHRFLVEYNQTKATEGRDQRLDELFEEQAKATPNRDAVAFGDEVLTYRQLDERADRVADHLRLLGVGPNDLVGIYIERSLDMVVGLLGVLKAGGAYLPLDPLYPLDRLLFMLEDAQPVAILTQRQLEKALPRVDTNRVYIDDLSNSRRISTSASARQRSTGDLAYVIYTSGSTGTPKGVQVTHRSIVNFLRSMRVNPGLTPDDALLAVTTLSFDIAGLELLLPLTVGALVVIASVQSTADATQLTSLLERHRITVMQATPATWHLLLQANWVGSPRLKILCGGESWSMELAEQLLPRCESLWNMYGPTETTVWSSVNQIKSGGRILIGQPIANTSFYVLQPDLQLAPLMVRGELYIGGDGVARGYLNRPELTEEKFIINPFSDDGIGRLYKTGDLVRYLPDGTLEFLGRLDTQVKIRGFRIELDEIASVLRQHAAVKDAAVLVQKNDQYDERLVAFVILASGQRADADDLRELVKRRLPPFMVPSALEIVERFPLTPAGKIDRKALQKSPVRRREGSGSHASPRTATERAVADIWSDILGIRSVGAHDDFFDLGGHSLMIVRVIYQINANLNVRLGVPDLFQNPTVELLAALIDGQQAEGPREPAVVQLQDGGSEIPLYFIYAGPDEFHLARLMGKRRPVFGIQVPWPIKWRQAVESNDVSSFPTMDQFVTPFAQALSAHVGSRPCMLAGHSFAGLVAFEVARQLQRLGGKIDTVLIVDKWARYPSPFGVALKNLGQCWTEKRVDIKQTFAKSLLARCRRSALIIWWPLRMIASAMLALVRRSPGQPTTTFDDEGAPLPWGLLARLYWNIEQNYYPQALDCRGIIFRTDFMDLNHSVRVLDQNLGWGPLFTRGVVAFSLAGDHISIIREHNESLASMINKVLQDSQEHR